MRSARQRLLWLAASAAAAAGCGGHGDQKPAVTIGVLSACEGVFGTFYDATLAGAELPLIRRGGKRAGSSLTDGVDGVSIGGRRIRLVFGCTDGTATSALGEARRLVERERADVLIGPLPGEEAPVIRAYARRRPAVTFVDGTASDQALRSADRPPNVFRFSIDGAQQMAGLGTYAYRELGWRRAVTIANPDPFQWAQHAGFVAEFCSLGGSIAKRIWLARGSSTADVVAQVPGGVDGVLVVSGPEITLALAERYRPMPGGPFRRILTGSLAVGYQDPRFHGAVYGDPTASGYSKTTRITGGPADERYVRAFRAAFPEFGAPPGQLFDAFYGTAMEAVLQALDAVDGDLSGGERRFMAALARVELDTFYGHVALDRYHQAIGPLYLVRQEGRSVRVLRRINGVEQTFDGYFSPGDPPPSATTPACMRRPPPRWAR